MEKQSPLRDNYITCTEPINPYHGNYVIINLSTPYSIQLPMDINNIWQIQSPKWKCIGELSPNSLSFTPPSWSDLSRNFIMPTHCVRTWSNGSYWWNSKHYFLTTSLSIVPLPRSLQYPEPQMGGLMYMYAHLMGMSNMLELPYRYSLYESNYSNGDSYRTDNTEYSRPFWTLPPQKDLYLNEQISASPLSAMKYIAGLNLTLFVIDISKNEINTTPCTIRTKMTLILKPLVPFIDLSGCWLNPPTNYNNYNNNQDWDGLYTLETTQGTAFTNGSSGEQLAVLPAIALDIAECIQTFEVVLPIQLYTLTAVSNIFSFTLQDVSNGSPTIPNMTNVATKIKGYFWDENGELTNANNASSIHFELQNNTSLFTLSHTFQEYQGRSNRPIYCCDNNSISIKKSDNMTSSILFSPKCGPGMWTNLPQNNF